MSIKLIRLILEGEGYHVRLPPMRPKLFKRSADFMPDLILALTKLLRSDQESRHVKIVAMSAYASAEDDQPIAAVGCAGFIPKSINTRNVCRFH
jgi:two-component system cell cycle response regulator DivK